ncbi:MAG: acetylxylan esterase [Lentisphaeria bacterium]|nr:acetylxylan esterase [Lentisphaeria bacterium]
MKLSFLAAVFAAVGCAAGELSVDAKTDKKDSIYKCGETVTVTAAALEDGKPVSGKTVTYTLDADGGFSKRGKFVSDAEKPWTFEYKFSRPGALRAEFTILGDDGKRIPLKRGYDQVRFAGGRIGAAAEPDKILPGGKTPEDFGAFWKAQLDRLAQVKPEVLERKKLDKLPGAYNSVDMWDVKVASVDGVPVSGYLAMPKKAAPKSLPAILLVQGAGVGSAAPSNIFRWAKEGAICLDINAHGVLNGQPRKYYDDLKKGKFKNYYSKVYPDREKHIFLNMGLRVVRALEYLRSLPEWNGRDLIIRGASQGGWQAVVGAALDPKVTMCVAGVPAFNDFDGEFSPEMRRMQRMHFGGAIRAMKAGKEKTAELLKAQSYFDGANFAPMIKCPVYVTVGYLDLSSPTTSVYALYNRISATTEKHITAYPGSAHAKCPSTEGDAAAMKVIKDAKK